MWYPSYENTLGGGNFKNHIFNVRVLLTQFRKISHSKGIIRNYEVNEIEYFFKRTGEESSVNGNFII